ncbi:hypothetical protein KR044_010239, partial [Drosophila immigrans]
IGLKMWKSLLIILMSGVVLSERSTRFTNLKCEVVDKSYVSFAKCNLKVVGRGIIAMNMHANLLKGPFHNAKVNLSLWRKYSGFRPFLYNATLDYCKAMACTNSTISFQRIIYRAMKTYSNLNHTCPYEVSEIIKDIWIRNLVFKKKHFQYLPLPSGEYQLQLLAATDKIWRTKVYVNLLLEDDL